MWQALIEHFRRFPAQERVIRLLIRNGLRIEAGSVRSGDVEVADSALARVAGVDRRVVRSTVDTVMADARLREAFTRLQPTLDLRDVAPHLGCGVVEVTPTDAAQPGTLAGVTQVFAQAGIAIRQCIVEDPDFTDAPRLLVVAATEVPQSLLPRLRAVAGVRDVRIG